MIRGQRPRGKKKTKQTDLFKGAYIIFWHKGVVCGENWQRIVKEKVSSALQLCVTHSKQCTSGISCHGLNIYLYC